MKPWLLFLALFADAFIPKGYHRSSGSGRAPCHPAGSILLASENSRGSNFRQAFRYDQEGRMIRCSCGDGDVAEYYFAYPDKRTVQVRIKELVYGPHSDTPVIQSKLVLTRLDGAGKILESILYDTIDTTFYQFRYNTAGKIAASTRRVQGYYTDPVGEGPQQKLLYGISEDSAVYTWREGNLVRISYYQNGQLLASDCTLEYAGGNDGGQHLPPGPGLVELNSFLLAGSTWYPPFQSRSMVRRVVQRFEGRGNDACRTVTQFGSWAFDDAGRLTSYQVTQTDGPACGPSFSREQRTFSYGCR